MGGLVGIIGNLGGINPCWCTVGGLMPKMWWGGGGNGGNKPPFWLSGGSLGTPLLFTFAAAAVGPSCPNKVSVWIFWNSLTDESSARVALSLCKCWMTKSKRCKRSLASIAGSIGGPSASKFFGGCCWQRPRRLYTFMCNSVWMGFLLMAKKGLIHLDD